MTSTVPMSPGWRLTHYELIEKLGEGGMGVVWRALDRRLDREVALKLLPEALRSDPDRLARLEREAKAVAALNHPNIVTIYSVESAEGFHFLTMELVRGRMLASLITPRGLPLEQILDIAIPICDAVGAAHERGIIHRDLKPVNIMIGEEGRVKILDFGLARFRQPTAATSAEVDSEADTLVLEPPSTPSGTIAYMAPERIRSRPLDHRADLFSLGVILYEMATGSRPFQGETPTDLAASILKDRPAPLGERNANAPPELERLVEHCLEKDPRQRIQAAVDLRIGLEDLRRATTRPPARSGPSIAVLPFADLSPEKDQGYFCEGMVEEIIGALTHVRGLSVASRTSSLRFREAAADAREIGRHLRVNTFLEGSVRKSSDKLRISVQLIDASEGYHVWSETYDRSLADVFAIQAEIARSVARALEVQLTPGEFHALRPSPTRDVQAYDYYLRGRSFYYRYGKRDIEFALQLFTRATELDPGYARAYAGMADCWSYLHMYAEGGESSRQRAVAASQKAIEFDPDLAEAHASRGFALSLGGRDAEAEQAFQQALALGPRVFEASYYYARHCFARGRAAEAARHYERASEVRPEDYQSLLLVAQVYHSLGREAEAHGAQRRGVQVVQEHLMLHPDDTRALYMCANGMVSLGRVEEGLEMLDRALTIGPREAMLLYNAGCIRALAGRAEEALDALEEAVACGLTQEGWFRNDSNLDGLREHPRFRALMERIAEANARPLASAPRDAGKP